jgi:TatD DNase family protein
MLPEPLGVPVADSHCHLDFEADDGSLPVTDALAKATAVNVTRLVQVGCDVASSRWSVDAAHNHAQVVASVALHPNEAPQLAESRRLDSSLDEIARLANDHRVRAIGETGLDYFRTGEDGRAAQHESFRRHISIAKDLDKTLMIHDREAHDDVVGILDSEGAPERVVLHCFSGDATFARVCDERGWFLSFAGTVTFKNAEYLRDALRVISLEAILVETDAPFLAPTPHRGRPNASYLIPLTIRAMAQVRGLLPDELAHVVDGNTTRAFGPW